MPTTPMPPLPNHLTTSTPKVASTQTATQASPNAYTAHCPHTDHRPPSLLIARWRSFAPGSRTKFGHRQRHIYTLAAKPSARLAIGDQITLLALSPASFHSSTPDNTTLETYNPHVAGSIAEIKPTGERARVRVVNECAKSLVGIAEIDIPRKWGHCDQGPVPRSRDDGRCATSSPEATVGLREETTDDDLLEEEDVEIRNEICGGNLCTRSSFEEWANASEDENGDWKSEDERAPDIEVVRRVRRHGRKPPIIGRLTESMLKAKRREAKERQEMNSALL